MLCLLEQIISEVTDQACMRYRWYQPVAESSRVKLAGETYCSMQVRFKMASVAPEYRDCNPLQHDLNFEGVIAIERPNILVKRAIKYA